MTIHKVGPKPPKTEGLSETSGPGAAEKPASVTGSGFKQELKSAPAVDALSDRLDAIIQDAASRMRAGQISRDQAIDFIIDSLRQDLLQGPLPADEVDRAVAWVREIITDDPTVDLLLGGK